jgi:hypothetical protein
MSTDQEAVAAIITVTAGNFWLIERLVSQVRRINQGAQPAQHRDPRGRGRHP